MKELEFNKTVTSKLKNNIDLTNILVELNKEPIKAIEALRELNQDKTLFSNYEAMLDNTERSIAISNILHMITEQIDANNETLVNMIEIDLTDIKSTVKDRFNLSKISSVSKNLDSLYKTLEQPTSTNLLNNMYRLDKLQLITLSLWFKENDKHIDNILDYDIETFINELPAITNTYTEQALEIIEAGDELSIDFDPEDRVLFNLNRVDDCDNTPSTIEAIKHLVDNSLGLETRLEVNTKNLLTSMSNFKPSKIALTKTIKASKQVLSDYNDNKITSEALLDLTNKYNNVIKTYFTIFSLRLNTLSSYIDVMETMVENHNRIISNITYLQNSFK